MKIMKTFSLLLALFVGAMSSDAAAQSDSFFSEFVEVRVTNVDVVVTDRSGKPVTGLSRDDFEIYEDGVRKELSNFLEVRGSAPAARLAATPQAEDSQATIDAASDIRRRDITIFVDNSALHPLRRNQILPALQNFMENNVRDGDTVSIVTWASSLKAVLEPTSNRAAIDEAVRSLGKSTTLNFSSQAKQQFYSEIAMLIRAYRDRVVGDGPPEKPTWGEGISIARGYAIQAAHEATQRIEALKSVIAWRRGADGRKILVMLTAEMPENPVDEPFLYLDSIRDQFANPAGTAMSEAREFDMPSIVQQVTAVANSAGVTLYPIDAAGKDAGMPDRSVTSGVSAVFDGATIVAPVLRPSLAQIADLTGGIALTGSDNWKLAFDTISNDLESYYSLGYRSDGERVDRVRKVEVKLKDGRHRVRTRQAVVERSITSEMQDAVAANLFRPSTANDLTVRATAGDAVPQSAEAVLVPVSVTIPMEQLTLIPDGEDLTGRVAIYAAFLRKDGAVSKVAQQPGVIRFPAASLAGRKELTVKIDVTMDGQTDGISVGVMDEFSRATGFAAVKLE